MKKRLISAVLLIVAGVFSMGYLSHAGPSRGFLRPLLADPLPLFCHLEHIEVHTFGAGEAPETTEGFVCEKPCLLPGDVCTLKEQLEPNGNVTIFCACVEPRSGFTIPNRFCDMVGSIRREGAGQATFCAPKECPEEDLDPDADFVCRKVTSITVIGVPGGRRSRITKVFCDCFETAED